MTAALDVPILANMTEFGKSELFSVDQLRDAGVNLVIWPVSLLRISMGAAGRALDTLNEEGHLTSALSEMQQPRRSLRSDRLRVVQPLRLWRLQLHHHEGVTMTEPDIKKGLAGVVVDTTAIS